MTAITSELMGRITKNLSGFPAEGIPFFKWRVDTIYSRSRKQAEIVGGDVFLGIFDNSNATSLLISRFAVQPFPNCKGIAIIKNVEVFPTYQSRGWGKFTVSVAAWLCREMDYSYAMATVQEENMAMRCVLAANGWRDAAEFNNSRRTGKDVVVAGLNLNGLPQNRGGKESETAFIVFE